MASTYKRGDVLTVKGVTPTGPVQSIRMDEDGNVFYLLEWQDADGETQNRWFSEAEVTAAGA